MKQKLNIIVTTISCIATALCLFRINGLENRIDNLENSLTMGINDVYNSVQSISGNVYNTLEEQANPLSGEEYIINGYNADEKTANITYCIIPKEYNPDITAATVTINDKEYDMTYSEGRYKADIDLPLLTESRINNIKLYDNGNIRTCSIDKLIIPREELLPTMYTYHGISHTVKYEKAVAKTEYNGYIDIDFIHKGLGFDKDKFEIIATLDNKEIYREKIKFTEMKDDEYMSWCSAEFKESFEIPKDSVFEMYVQYSDTNGWQYRGYVESMRYYGNGNMNDNYNGRGDEAEIFTEKGRPLFVAQ